MEHEFKHTKNNFKEWLSKANYKDILNMYQAYKEKLMEYRFTMARDKNLYALIPGTKKENMKIVKWKYNLLTNQLNLMTLKGGK